MKRKRIILTVLGCTILIAILAVSVILFNQRSHMTPVYEDTSANQTHESDKPASPSAAAASKTPLPAWSPASMSPPAATPSDTAPASTPPDTSPAETPATGTPGPDKDQNEMRAEAILSKMSTWEKVCQLFIVYPESIGGVSPATAAGPRTKSGLEKYPVGGIVYFSQNLVSREQTATMIENIQSFSQLGLFIAADEEGGIVNRLMSKLGTTYIKSMYNYRNDGPETAYSNAATIAKDMAAFGFNTDFAPVADVWSNKKNTVIAERAYSDNFETAAELVASAVKGFNDNGIVCTLKHFPGHGDTAEDSHYESAYVNKTVKELMAQELLPFISGLNAGADMVMVGHLTVPAIDKVPATISYKIVTGLLRKTLGYDGVVITDGLGMNAIAGHYTTAEIAVKSIQAGTDILLGPASLPKAADGLMAALDSGELTIDRIDQSVLRILKLKLEHGIIK